MTSHAFTSIRRAALGWRSGFSLASGAVAGLFGLLGWPAVVPSVVWWGVALALMFVTAWRGYYEAERERDHKRKPLPDMPLVDVVAQIIGTPADKLFDEGNPQKVSDALCDIREKALLDAISTWGRRDCNSMDLRFYPLNTIERAAWENLHVDYLAFMRDRRCALGDWSGQPTAYKLSDIHMNRDQVDRVWPKKAVRRFDVGWPGRKAAA